MDGWKRAVAIVATTIVFGALGIGSALWLQEVIQPTRSGVLITLSVALIGVGVLWGWGAIYNRIARWLGLDEFPD